MKMREILARNMRRLRAERRMSQEKLGFEADITTTYVSLIETEKYAASIDVIERIAIALKVAPADLLADTPKPRRTK
jgi:transcriptional regulator with XRE-family HTH domain